MDFNSVKTTNSLVLGLIALLVIAVVVGVYFYKNKKEQDKAPKNNTPDPCIGL